MKKTFVIKAIAAIFATAMMSFTTATEASAQNTFVYGQDGNTMTVSTLNADGISITPKLKYEYQYDTPKLKYEYQYDANGNLAEKKAYRWNADNRSWQPAYLLNYLPGDGIYLIDYAEYDKASGAFTQNIQTSIYYQQAENGMLLTDIQR